MSTNPVVSTLAPTESDELSINMGEIVSIKDVSPDGHTTVQVTNDLINKKNIDIIYGMHPAISYRDLSSD